MTDQRHCGVDTTEGTTPTHRRGAMSRNVSKLTVGLVAVAVTLFAGVAAIQAAEQKSANEILNALKPKCLTRSLSGAAPAPKTLSAGDRQSINSLRSKGTRSLTVSARDRLASIATDNPSTA